MKYPSLPINTISHHLCVILSHLFLFFSGWRKRQKWSAKASPQCEEQSRPVLSCTPGELKMIWLCVCFYVQMEQKKKKKDKDAVEWEPLSSIPQWLNTWQHLAWQTITRTNASLFIIVCSWRTFWSFFLGQGGINAFNLKSIVIVVLVELDSWLPPNQTATECLARPPMQSILGMNV